MNFLGLTITPEVLSVFKGLLLNYKRLNILADAADLFQSENPDGSIDEFKTALIATIDNLTAATGNTGASPVAKITPTIAMLSEQVRAIATNL